MKEKKQEVEEEKCKEIKINIIKDNPSAKKNFIKPKDVWPKRKRTDITELYH